MTSMMVSKRWTTTGRLCLVPIVVALLVAVTSAAGEHPSALSQAAPALPPVTYNQSCERTAQTQIAMDECAGTELLEVQRQLNAALAAAERGAGASFVRLVNSAEQTFEAYEKAECKVAAAPNIGGTIYPLIFGNCEVRLTVQRLQEVREDALGVSEGHG
jgi:uncharacterized protein YecT (DUF1311 family)